VLALVIIRSGNKNRGCNSMKTNIREAIMEIRKQSVNIVVNNAKIEDLYAYISKEYNVPSNLVFDMLFGNKANNKFGRFEKL
jgi:flagellar biosynthesis/type III secretory pathway M-ring protein FliF/YscJ